MFSSPIDEIKSRLDIIDVIGGYIKLQKAGANYRAVCPFHSEKKPSFFVSPARQLWRCFGCNLGGDIFAFVKQINGVEFGDALRILAQKAGVELKREDPKIKSERQHFYEINNLACRFFEQQLEKSVAGQEARKYLIERGLKEETIKNWRLGYSPDVWQGLSDFLVSRGYQREEMEKVGLVLKSAKTGNYYDRFRGRIMFPIFDLGSQVVAFGGRVFKQNTRPDNQEEAKYINTPATSLYDKSRILYGLNKAGVAIRKNSVCILVEGYMDALMAYQAGTENVVATSGTALTSFQLNILKRYSDNLLTAFDMDVAGDSATKRGIDLAQSIGFNIKVIVMPGKDPGDVAKDPDNWQNLINNPKTIHDFYFENTLAKFDKNTLEGKKEISKVLLPVIKRIPNKIEQTFWIQSLVNALSVKEQDIIEELNKTKAGFVDFRNQEQAEQKAIEQKSRKELLEERLIILALRSPQNLELVKEDDLKYLSSNTSFALNYFKINGLEMKNIESVSLEQKEFLDNILMKSEADDYFLDKKSYESDGSKEAELCAEFNCCLKEIRGILVKSKLDEISSEIKKAESEKNFEKVQKLIEEFNCHSKSRCDFEKA